MTLQLSAPTEKVVPYEYFGNGRVVDLMPELVKAGYHPAGIAALVDGRQHAPEEVRANFNTYFWTGDSAGTDKNGGALLTVDSPLLRELTAESPLLDGALRLTLEQWTELRADKEHSLYLTPTEVEAAHGKGYVLENGKFVPANRAVAKAWDHLNRGNDVQSYAQMVSRTSKSNNIMRVYFDRSEQNTQTLRSLVLDRVDGSSGVYGHCCLNVSGGRLVGVAQEGRSPSAQKGGSLLAPELSAGKSRTEHGGVTGAHVARKKSLEARVQSALNAGKAFEFNGIVYAPVSGVSLK
ncbi:hypothetical protein HYS49_02480 [Candidatus Woesearchaeota archaeon]|nr:hypothetical protein [Candidatus Woesearchaeota archaeon]